MKLNYYKKHFWEAEFIEDAENTINMIYKNYSPPDEGREPFVDDDSEFELARHVHMGSDHGPYEGQEQANQTELERYLASPCVYNWCINVLVWWKVCTIMLHS